MKFKRIILLLFLLGIVFVFITNQIIESTTQNLVYTDSSTIPHNKAGLLLGTSQFLKSGQKNQYFANRIEAASKLYKAKYCYKW